MIKKTYLACEEEAESFDDFQNFNLLKRLVFFLESLTVGAR